MLPPGEGEHTEELAPLVTVALVALVLVSVLIVLLIVYYGFKITEEITIKFSRYGQIPGEEAN